MNGRLSLHSDRKVTTSVPVVPGSPVTIQATLYSTTTEVAGDGIARVPYDLSGLSVLFELIERGRRERATSRLATITDADDGLVEVALGGYETAQAGSYAARFIVLDVDGVTQLARFPADDGVPVEIGGRSDADKLSLLNRAISAALAAIDSAAEALASQVAAAASAVAAAASEAAAAGWASALALAQTAFVDVPLSSIAALEASIGSVGAIRTVRGVRGGRFFYFASYAAAQAEIPGLSEMTEAQAFELGLVFDTAIDPGTLWVRQWDGREIRPEWGADQAVSLQTAINVTIESDTLSREIPLPAVITTDETVHIRRAANAQASVGLIGKGPAFWGEIASQLHGSVVDFGTMPTDRPGVVIQSGRYARLFNLSLRGPLDTYVDWAVNGAGPGAGVSHDLAVYHAEMVGVSVSRESPLAGLVVDAYTAAGVPADPYPETTFYGTGGASASCEADRVGIRGFGVGVLIHPANSSDFNSSEIELRVDSFANVVGISVGNGQARSVIVKELSSITYGHVAITGFRHGLRIGPMPRVRSLNVFGVYRLFEAKVDRGVVDVEGVHAELIAEIGLFGVGTTNNPYGASVRTGHYSYTFRAADSISATPIFAACPMEWRGNAHIREENIAAGNEPAANTYNLGGGNNFPLSFQAERFQFAAGHPIVLFASPTSRQIRMEACVCASTDEFKQVNTHSALQFARPWSSHATRRIYVAPWVETLQNLADGATYALSFDRPGHSGGMSDAWAVDTWDWGAGTFHVTSADGRRLFVGDRIAAPCILDTDPLANPWASGNWENLPALRVTAYDAGTRIATFERLFHADAIDEAQTPTHIQYAVRQFCLPEAITADFTDTSPTVAVNLGGIGGDVSDYFHVGDEIVDAPGTHLANSSTRILSIDDGAGTVTFTHNAVGTAAAVGIHNVRMTAL